VLRPYGIIEMVRTGMVSMLRGAVSVPQQAQAAYAAGTNGNGNGKYVKAYAYREYFYDGVVLRTTPS
jgi:hypothetical protein